MMVKHSHTLRLRISPRYYFFQLKLIQSCLLDFENYVIVKGWWFCLHRLHFVEILIVLSILLSTCKLKYHKSLQATITQRLICAKSEFVTHNNAINELLIFIKQVNIQVVYLRLGTIFFKILFDIVKDNRATKVQLQSCQA